MKFVLYSSLLMWPLAAQLLRPEIPQSDQAIANDQANDVFRAVRAVTGKASEVVFPIYSYRRQIAYGVSLGEGVLLAKLSEVADKRSLIFHSEQLGGRTIKILGAYPEQDVALLYVEGLKAPAAKWVDGSNLEEGSFLVAVRHDGEAQGVGVKSVAARSLRSEDQGYLGVELSRRNLGNGVLVIDVVDGSAAQEADILPGDIIRKVKGEEVKGFHEVSTRLKRLKAGETPEILISRKGKELIIKPTLHGNTRRNSENPRLRAMQTQSGARNRKHDDFPNVVQSDMELKATDTGLPIVDLRGRMIGMVIARAGRISTLILPSREITRLLKTEPLTNSRDPEIEKVQRIFKDLRERVELIKE